ncbi:unnamed protein product [Allacma fusca]|uniref:Uncharacterized protein n=1 Tax=Allacma fusca TaxID=39272 RepID=A0A8J2PEI0_9HEXA|nr:unnamed protein product [Allacma fusca]
MKGRWEDEGSDEVKRALLKLLSQLTVVSCLHGESTEGSEEKVGSIARMNGKMQFTCPDVREFGVACGGGGDSRCCWDKILRLST